MKENNCKIIKDLLPSYIDNLTSQDTNNYIEEHLNHCEHCKKTVENMKKELELDPTKKDSKEVKYIKKFNKKLNLLKMIILGIILIILFSLARKMIILVSLNNKANYYTSSTNYYMKELNYGGAVEDINIYQTYVKDDKYIVKAKMVSDFCKVTSANYYNGEKLNRYVEFKYDEETEKNVSTKTAYLNDAENILFPVLWNELDFKHSIKLHGIALIFTSISSEICNEKDCYRILIPSLDRSSSTIYYVDKETGLTIRIIAGRSIGVNGKKYDSISDFRYEFNSVTDEDFLEPNIKEYEIKE